LREEGVAVSVPVSYDDGKASGVRKKESDGKRSDHGVEREGMELEKLVANDMSIACHRSCAAASTISKLSELLGKFRRTGGQVQLFRCRPY
jgi:hypothetical protein